MFEFTVFLLVSLAYVAIAVVISTKTDKFRKMVTLDQALEYSQRKSKICNSRVVSVVSSLGLKQKPESLNSDEMQGSDVKKGDTV